MRLTLHFTVKTHTMRPNHRWLTYQYRRFTGCGGRMEAVRHGEKFLSWYFPIEVHVNTIVLYNKVCYFSKFRMRVHKYTLPITFIVVVDLITTVPATLSPGKKVLVGDLSFISKTVDDIVKSTGKINCLWYSQVKVVFNTAVGGVSFTTEATISYQSL